MSPMRTGRTGSPFTFDGSLSHADRELWRRIDLKLNALAASGSRSLKVLDAGCGPGTWLLRIALRAREIGFAAIELRGLDISPKMVALAQDAIDLDGICLDVRIEVGELSEPLSYATGQFDISLCLYGVLNHLSAAARRTLAASLARVTGDTMFVTVRTAGSLPTIYVDGLEKAGSYHQDNRYRLAGSRHDGRKAPGHSVPSLHLRRTQGAVRTPSRQHIVHRP